MDDGFDPTTWPDEIPYVPIQLGGRTELFTVVDRDLEAEIREVGSWCLYDWGGKQYARKTMTRTTGGQYTLYMHRFIAVRHIEKPEDPQYHLVDHKSGNGLDNRLYNLVWATPQLNALNRYGMWWQQKDFLRELESGDWERVKKMTGQI